MKKKREAGYKNEISRQQALEIFKYD